MDGPNHGPPSLLIFSVESSFIDETRRLTQHSESFLGAIHEQVSQFSRSSLMPSVASTCRSLHTVLEVEPAWKVPSLAAVSKVPGSSSIRLEDANILLVLLSFLPPSEKIPLDLLFRGARPRRCWTVQGEIKEVDALYADLTPEWGSLLSDTLRLGNALHELDLSSTVSKNSDRPIS